MIESSSVLSIRRQCSLLGLNRSTLYYKPTECLEDIYLTNEISEIWHDIPVYGYRRIGEELKRRGYHVNHKRVLRLMKESGLMAIYPKKKTTVRDTERQVYPYLLRGMRIDRPNQVWSTDLTYIKVAQGFVYLMAIIDVYSRHIVGWDVSNTMDKAFCVNLLKEALKKGVPGIINTDQGSQYTSKDWVTAVLSAGAKVSMDGVGRWADNIPIERFWRTVKWENLLLKGLKTVSDVRSAMTSFMVFYNERRLHSALSYATPHEVYGGSRHTISVVLGLKAYDKTDPPLENIMQPLQDVWRAAG